MLSAFDLGRDTFLYVDASRRGLGYILLQKDEQGRYRIICCGSTGLSSAQSRYSVIKLKLLAVVYALSKCRFYLQGIRVVNILTDHRPLVDLYKKPLTEIANARLFRLIEQTMDFNLSWSYVKGDRNYIADLFSRTQVSSQEAPEFPRTTNMEVKRVTEGAGKKTICREMEVMAIQAKDDQLYQEVIRAIQEER